MTGARTAGVPTAGSPPRASAGFRAARELALALLVAPPPLLVVTDFDGTLAPISLDPLGAVIDPLARRAVRRLARLAERRPERVSIVVLSGRTALDVAGRIRVGGVHYLGNHGLEGGALAPRARPGGLRVTIDPALERFAGPARALAYAVAERLGRPDWLFVELKGPSIAFHFRQAPQAEVAREEILAAIEGVGSEMPPPVLGDSRTGDSRTGVHDRGDAAGLAMFEGRKVIELRPLGAGGKGAALERLLERERPGAVLVLGDDRSDAEAFRVVTAARERGELAGLAVGVHGAAETPLEIADAADIELAAPHEAARLLSAVATAIERESDEVGATGRRDSPMERT